MASISQPLTVSAIKVFAWTIANRGGQKNRFNKTSGPGHTWWAKFRKRHKNEITLRKPDTLDRGRARMANQHVMNNHFTKLREVLQVGDYYPD